MSNCRGSKPAAQTYTFNIHAKVIELLCWQGIKRKQLGKYNQNIGVYSNM
jgi:hypothetical protein